MKALILSALLLAGAAVPTQAATFCAGTVSLTTSPTADGNVVTARFEEFPLYVSHHACTQYTGGIVWFVTYCYSWLDDNCDTYLVEGPGSTPPSGVTVSFRPNLPGIHLVTAILVDLPELTPDGTHPNPDRVKKVIWRQLGPNPPDLLQRRAIRRRPAQKAE